MRAILVAIKLFLNKTRRLINLYNLILGVSPFKKSTARLLGSILAPSCHIKGALYLYEPAWFQMNRGSRSGSITMRKNSFLLIDHDVKSGDIDIAMPTVFTANLKYAQTDSRKKHVTISVDLEGGVGLSHASKKQFKSLHSLWNSRPAAYALYTLFKKYSIPVTWAVCGHLFLDSCDMNHGFDEHDWYGDWFTYDPGSDADRNPDWYMPDFIRILIDDKEMEVGYHSFGHFNYLNASHQTIFKDLEWATRLRQQFCIPLKTMVFPYNAVSHIAEALGNGFSCFRGYIGQFYIPMTVNFGPFTFYGTSMFLGPVNIGKRVCRIYECIGKNFNYFLHPENWVGKDLTLLEQWCSSISHLRQKGLISLKTLGADENK